MEILPRVKFVVQCTYRSAEVLSDFENGFGGYAPALSSRFDQHTNLVGDVRGILFNVRIALEDFSAFNCGARRDRKRDDDDGAKGIPGSGSQSFASVFELGRPFEGVISREDSQMSS